MEKADIRDIISMMEASSLTRLEYQGADFRLLLEKTGAAAAAADRITENIEPAASVQHSDTAGEIITSPLVGTLYLSSGAGEEPYAAEGDEVSEGSTLCLIEAMKMFSEVKADFSGIVREILAANEQPVEFGTPIFRIERKK